MFDPPCHPMDLCPTCGLVNGLHRGVGGSWLGCDVARFTDIGSRRRPVEPIRFNDPYMEITAAVRAAMVNGAISARLEQLMSDFSNDEQLNIAAAIVRVAVGTYIAQLAERGR